MSRMIVRAVAGCVAALVAAVAFAADVNVWAVPDGYKIDKFGKKIFVIDPKQDLGAIKRKNILWDADAKTIALAAARGETLAFQLGIEGEAQGLKDVNVQSSDLVGPNGAKLSAAQLELFKIYYTEVNDKGSGATNGPTMGKGWYPDALVPWALGDSNTYGGYDGPPFAVKPNEIQGVWIDLAIPYGTPAGQYAGTLTVSAAGANAATVKVSLKVRDFDIPRKIHAVFFMNGGVDDMNQSGGGWLDTPAKRQKYEEQMYVDSRRHRFTCGNMYDESRPNVTTNADGTLKVDWAGYDGRFGKVLSPTNNIFGTGQDAIEVWKVPLFTGIKSGNAQFPPGEKAWDQMIVEIKNHWKEKGWDISRAYAYLADEPPRGQAEKLNDYAKRVKNSPGPNLGRQIAVYTILGKSWTEQKPIFDLWKDNLDWWMVAGDYYNVPDMDALAKDHKKAFYQGGEPYQGNETLDADGIAMRTWSWIAWQYKLDYECYYSMTEAWRKATPDPRNPDRFIQGRGRAGENNDNEIWDHPRNRTWAISQGVFIYPGKKVNFDLPIWNIRTKQIRRGQTDYEYFWLLKQAGEERLANDLCKKVLNVALSEAASAPEQYGYGKWSHNPADWDNAVQAAGDRLEQIKDKLPKE